MYDEKAIKHYQRGMELHQKGQLTDAERAYAEAINISKDFVEAYNNLANVLVDLRRLGEAAQVYRKALEIKPNHPILLNNLGNTLQLQGNNEDAIEWLNKAIAAQPDYAEAHENLGNALRGSGGAEAAADCYRRAIELDPDFAGTYNNLGGVLAELGELDAAKTKFKQAIAIDPANSDAYNGLGNVLSEQKEYKQALAAYSGAIKINPGYRDAYNGMGNIFSKLEEKEKAIELYRKAIEIDPEHTEAYNGLGSALSGMGEIDNAIAAFRKSIEINPGSKDAHFGMGNALTDMGEIEDAIASYRRAIDIFPGYAAAYRAISKNKKFTELDDDVRAMELLNADESITEKQEIHLAFALGKAYEDLGKYAESMEHILKANRLTRASFDYSLSREQDKFSNIKSIFCAEFFSARKGCGDLDSTPIFILGMPRSGTSLAEQILASHPEVFGAGELSVMSDMVRNMEPGSSSSVYPLSVADLNTTAFEDFGQKYIAKLREHSADSKFITDKMPHNFLHIGFIHAILPNAKIICCTRDPMDNCLSIFKNYFTTGHYYSYELQELGQYYNLYLDLMAHWKNTLPGFIYDLNYEALISDQENQIRKLLEYCNLPWDDACLQFHKTRRKVATASKAQVRQPIYKDSINLWKRYETQLEPLRTAIYD